MLNIIMYHYVRNNEEYIYDTYCRRKNEFEAQIEFFRKSSEVVDPADLQKIKFYLENDNQNAYLLTFDDGYKDHLYCSKYLYDKNIKAYFFSPINALCGNILDVNAIHMLIGLRGIKIQNILKILSEICLSSNLLLNLNNQKVVITSYLEKFNNNDIYDDRNTLMLKRILQRDLVGEDNRKLVIDTLIKRFIDIKYSDIASELYLNTEDIKNMKKMGMLFGSHGNTHKWLNSLNYVEQKDEIEQSFISLNDMKLISFNEPKAMCYPFGGYDSNTIKLMNDLKIDLGFTTEIGPAKYKEEKDFIFKLPRFDTNHFWDNKWRRPCNII